jgi:hypothetical protein
VRHTRLVRLVTIFLQKHDIETHPNTKIKPNIKLEMFLTTAEII